MRSQKTFNLIQSAKEINVAINSDGDRVGGLLNERYSTPVSEGEPAFDYRQHMRQLPRQLGSALEGVITAEDDHSEQLIRVSRAQDERNEITTRSYDKLVAARQGLEGLYKSGGFELAFLSGKTPQVPKKLCEQLGQSVKLLEQPAVEWRDSKVKGFNINRDEMAADLKSEWTALVDVLDLVADAKKAAEVTLLAKREATDELSRTVIWVGRTAEGLFHLAGEDELAKRIRTSARRSLNPSEPEETEETDSQEPDSQVPDSQEPDSQEPDSQAP